MERVCSSAADNHLSYYGSYKPRNQNMHPHCHKNFKLHFHPEMEAAIRVTTTRSQNPHGPTEDKAVLHRQLLWHLCRTGQSHDGDSMCAHTHTLPQTYTTVAFRKIRRQSNFALAGIEYTNDQTYVHIYMRESSLNRTSCTLETDRPQHDHPAAVFFCQTRLNAPPLPQAKIRRHFQ